MSEKVGRNAPCPCGSGRKYKQCCLNRRAGFNWRQKLLIAFLALAVIGGSVTAVVQWQNREDAGRVWSEEHQHWHPAP